MFLIQTENVNLIQMNLINISLRLTKEQYQASHILNKNQDI